MANKWHGRIKGTQYIAQRLTKNFPNKYPTYKSALPHAKAVLLDIQDAGEDVNLKNIFSKIRVKRTAKGDELGQLINLSQMKEMMKEIHYFDIDGADFPRLIAKLPNKLILKSKLFPDTVKQPLFGGGNYSYHELFAPYVTFIDSQREETEDSSRYNIDWFVKWTTPVPDKTKKGFFVSNFVSIDANGDDVNYGFNPKDVKEKPAKPVLSEGEVPEKYEEEKYEEEKETTQPSSERIRLAEIASAERIKMEKLKEAKELLKEKVISFQEYKELVKEI